MSREYAESRIKEALRNAKGNPTRARQQVIAWTFEDAKLLQALVRPHLSGIVAYAVNRVVDKANTADEPEEVLPETPAGLDMSPESFGKEILQALQSQNTARFGQESFSPSVGRKAASQRHIDALKQMARKDISDSDAE